jgi:hypothetical protein
MKRFAYEGEDGHQAVLEVPEGFAAPPVLVVPFVSPLVNPTLIPAESFTLQGEIA